MSTELQEHVWNTSSLKGNSLLLLIALANNADTETAECWPGIKYLAKRTRMSPRHVQRLLRVLETAHEVTIDVNGSKYGSNLYRILKTPQLSLGFHDAEEAEIKGGDKMSGGGDKMSPVTQLCRGGGDTAMSPKPSLNLKTLTSPDSKESEEVAADSNIRPFPVPVKDLSEAIFKNEPGTCLFYMIARGYGDRQSRGLLGKWRRQIGDAALVEIMGAASRKQVEDVVEYMSGAVRARKARTAKGERDHVSVL